jgi:hypothetical protein
VEDSHERRHRSPQGLQGHRSHEIHLAGEDNTPPKQAYFDKAWQRAVADGLVDAGQRADYGFQLQLPTTIYEASR